MPRVPQHLCGAAILVVDDDGDNCEMTQQALASVGFDVRVATSGAEAAAMARSAHFDLLVIDLRLPDMPGTQVIRDLRHDLINTPFLLVSGFLSTTITVDAMKLGAADVLEKPVSVDKLLSAVVSTLVASLKLPTPTRAVVAPAERSRRRSGPPRSSADRWAQHVVKACTSEGDLTTLESWAKFIGVSCSSLCESCRMLDIQPRDARDFARILRALIQAGIHRCSPYVLLDVSDRRTLRHLTERAGLRPDSPMSVEQFLDEQHLIPPEHEAVRRLRAMLSATGTNQPAR